MYARRDMFYYFHYALIGSGSSSINGLGNSMGSIIRTKSDTLPKDCVISCGAYFEARNVLLSLIL